MTLLKKKKKWIHLNNYADQTGEDAFINVEQVLHQIVGKFIKLLELKMNTLMSVWRVSHYCLRLHQLDPLHGSFAPKSYNRSITFHSWNVILGSQPRRRHRFPTFDYLQFYCFVFLFTATYIHQGSHSICLYEIRWSVANLERLSLAATPSLLQVQGREVVDRDWLTRARAAVAPRGN